MTKSFYYAVPYSTPGRDSIISQLRESGNKINPLTVTQIANLALTQNCKIKDCCIMCGVKIEMMCQKNTNVCSELCRKDRDGDHATARAISP
jgi:hypothetical protein